MTTTPKLTLQGGSTLVHDERVLLALDALTGVAGVVRIAVGAFDAGAVT